MSSKMLENRSLIGSHFNIKDPEKFRRALTLLRESLVDGASASMFSADNLIAWNRNLSFLRDDFYLDILNNKSADPVEKSIIWRTYILLYFCKHAIRAKGDFMELGCYQGSTAFQIIKGINFKKQNKRYYLYDLFSWKEGDEHSHFTGHDDPNLYEKVSEKFLGFPFVKIIRGSVPDSFNEGVPDKVAFAHIDMNHPVAESKALEIILPKLSSGGVIIFDDYGWWGYSAQKIALDPIASKHGLEILELPTGQGLLIKP